MPFKVPAGGEPPPLADYLFRYWPCVSGEDTPPTFVGNGAYGSSGGQTWVSAGAGTVTPSAVTWARIVRYAATGTDTPLVVTYLWYQDIATGFGAGGQPGVGFLAGAVPASVHGMVVGGAGAAMNHAFLQVNGAVVSGHIDLAPAGPGWRYCELVFTKTMTRLTIDKDATMRLTGPALADAGILGSWRLGYRTGSTTTDLSKPLVSNLLASFPTQVPA